MSAAQQERPKLVFATILIDDGQTLRAKVWSDGLAKLEEPLTGRARRWCQLTAGVRRIGLEVFDFPPADDPGDGR